MNVCEAVEKRVSKLLKERKMTAYRLEQKSGILHGTLAGLLSGKNKSVDFKTILMLANGFDMSVIDFLQDELFLDKNTIELD